MHHYEVSEVKLREQIERFESMVVNCSTCGEPTAVVESCCADRISLACERKYYRLKSELAYRFPEVKQ